MKVFTDRLVRSGIVAGTAETALIGISRNLELESAAAKVFSFRLSIPKKSELVHCKVIIKVIKGSILTHVWNAKARIDDEYICEYTDLVNNTFQLWSVCGFEANRVSKGNINWIKMREIMMNLDIQGIGLLSFSSLFGYLLLSFPCNSSFPSEDILQPMPALAM